MDGAVVAALSTGAASMLTAVGVLVGQVRRDTPEDVSALRARAERSDKRARDAETRADGLESRVLLAEATIFRLRQVLARHGITFEDPPLTPPGGVPAQRGT